MRAGLTFLAGAAILGVSTAGMLAGQEPFASWYYHFAWLGALLAGDAAVAKVGGVGGRRGRFLLLDNAAATAALFFWSAVLWLFFEAVNLRLQNWYYIFVPRGPAVRWIGEFVAFGTVIPAVLVSKAILDGSGFARGARWKPIRVTERRLRALPVAGLLCLTLPLVWPTYFFPLVWAGLAPILEPFVYRRAPERSLLADFERGEPARLLRLLAGGAAIGLIWEMFNIAARTKWIYTVPGFVEAPRLFEMPILGFFGFPPFAVECFVAWQALTVAGLVAGPAAAAPMTREAGNVPSRVGAEPMTTAPARRRLAVVAAAIGSAVVLSAMDSRTIDSLRPTLDRVSRIPAGVADRLQSNGYDVFRLADAEPPEVVDAVRNAAIDASRDQPAIITGSTAADWIAAARLATFRGIGAERAAILERAGIAAPADLADTQPATLSALLQHAGWSVPLPRLRIWVHAARRLDSRAAPAP